MKLEAKMRLLAYEHIPDENNADDILELAEILTTDGVLKPWSKASGKTFNLGRLPINTVYPKGSMLLGVEYAGKTEMAIILELCVDPRLAVFKKVWTPHVAASQKIRGTGMVSKIYGYLIQGGLIFYTEKHTKDAAKLWTRVGGMPGVELLTVQHLPTGTALSTSPPGPKDGLILGTTKTLEALL